MRQPSHCGATLSSISVARLGKLQSAYDNRHVSCAGLTAPIGAPRIKGLTALAARQAPIPDVAAPG